VRLLYRCTFDCCSSHVREIVAKRGFVSNTTVQNFLLAGYTKEQLMEVLIGIAMKDQQLPGPHQSNSHRFSFCSERSEAAVKKINYEPIILPLFGDAYDSKVTAVLRAYTKNG
jgi:hypothetical protein